MEYEYASERKIYYPQGDGSLRAGAKYLASKLSYDQRKVFYEYANNHSAGASFLAEGKSYLLKKYGSDYIIS